MVASHVPRFRVPHYDTLGSFPQVRGDGIDLRAVNDGLRAGIVADQGEYARDPRVYARNPGRDARGLYDLSIDRRFLSASTVVVSALLPAGKLFIAGSGGRTWVAVTVRVPSGKRVALQTLFSHPAHAIKRIAREWLRRARAGGNPAWGCIRANLSLSPYSPKIHNYRHFALTTFGLAIGFWQPGGPCDRLVETIPYLVLKPYLSPAGRTLIAGVRAPRVIVR